MSPRIPIRLLAAQSDQRLLGVAREGHGRAFEALVARYRRPLLRYCRRSMRLSEARSEDVLQHALLQAWLALEGGTLVRDVKPWLYRIVHNAAVNAMRGSAENVTELTDAMHARMAGASESDLDRRIAVHDALSDVAALPPMQRQAIFLTAFDGQTHEEVASALGISHGAVRGLLYRARATLRTAAAAITPQWLIQWASGAGGSSAPSTERLAELSVGGGAIGMTGVLAKGAAIAVTAGALVTGAAVVHGHGHAVDRARGRTSALLQPARVKAASPGVPTATLLAASKAGAASTEETAAARHLARARAPAARGEVRHAHRILAASPARPGAARDTKLAGAPGGGDNTDLADGAGLGSSSGSRSQGGQDSRGESSHGSDSSGNRPAGQGSGGGSGSSDGSGGQEPEPSPSAGHGEAGGTAEQANSSGDPVLASAEPPSKTDG